MSKNFQQQKISHDITKANLFINEGVFIQFCILKQFS
jgi:hypothetical protein